MTKYSRYLYYFIIIWFVSHVLSVFLGQLSTHGEESIADTGTWYGKMDLVTDLILCGVSIFCFVSYHKYFPVFISVCYGLMVTLVFIASFDDLSMFLTSPTAFFSPKGIGTWINFGILFFAAEEAYTNKLFNLFKYFCYSLFIFNIVRIGMIGSVGNRSSALNAIRDTTIEALWIYPFFFLKDDDNTTLFKLAKYFLVMLLAFFAFSIAARSYLLTVMIYLMIKLKRDLKEGKNSVMILWLIGVVLMGGYYFAANIDSFGTLKDLFSIFTGRVGEDSRSGQIKEFLDQFDTSKLFRGVGPSAKWNWSADRENLYEWLDNQYLLAIWWFGLQTCVVYILYLLYTIFKRNPLKLLAVSNAKITIFFWVLACGGFGIYVTFSSSLYYCFISLLMGMITLNVRTVTLYQRNNQEELVQQSPVLNFK